MSSVAGSSVRSAPAVLALRESREHIGTVGGKAVGLGRLLEHGFSVPPGFVVTTDAYSRSIAGAGLKDTIAELVSHAVDADSEQAASRAIQQLFTADVLALDVATAIDEAYTKLGDSPPVAVRSSASAEDLATASFAGQQDTFLGISGGDAVREHVVRCWASLFTSRAIAYRRRHSVPLDGLAMAVVIQRLVDARAAGVMMTIEPVTGDRSCLYIEVAYGLGEGVVRGDVGTDRLWISKRPLCVVRQEIGDKAEAHVFTADSNGVQRTVIREDLRTHPVLSETAALALASLGLRAEEVFGMAMDVEWAIGSDDQPYLLQARPETVWNNVPRAGLEAAAPGTEDPLDSVSDPRLHWTRGNVGEAFPGVQTPLSWTTVAPAIEYGARESAYAIGAFSPAERPVPAQDADRIIRIFRGRVAAKVEFVTMIGDRLPGTSGQEVARSIFGHVPGDIDYQPTRVRYPAIAYRLPRTSLTMPRALRAFADKTDDWYRREIDRAPRLEVRAAQRQLRGAQQRLGWALRIQSTIALAVIQPLYHALEHLVQRAGCGDIGVLSGTGNVEMELVSDIWRAATGRVDLDAVVREHGFHGPDEGELSSRVWREDPTPLEHLLPRYARRENPRATSEHASLRAAQRELLGGLPVHQRPAAALVLRLAAAHLPSRGTAKRSYLQCFDVARAASRRLGAVMAEQGRIRDAEDVFYLTVTELTGVLPAEADAVIAKRKLWRRRHLAVDVPPLWSGVPEPLAPGRAPADGGTITGVGVSAGVVEGTVRVILDPSIAAVGEHDILVAPTTDASWSSIMFVSAGLVVDIGGALSHAAVVARELGIPCIVNTKTGTTSLETGDRVRIDGSTGTVTILERAPRNA